MQERFTEELAQSRRCTHTCIRAVEVSEEAERFPGEIHGGTGTVSEMQHTPVLEPLKSRRRRRDLQERFTEELAQSRRCTHTCIRAVEVSEEAERFAGEIHGGTGTVSEMHTHLY